MIYLLIWNILLTFLVTVLVLRVTKFRDRRPMVTITREGIWVGWKYSDGCSVQHTYGWRLKPKKLADK